jgi:hypothetical protein
VATLAYSIRHVVSMRRNHAAGVRQAIAGGAATALVVANLDRLSRSMLDFVVRGIRRLRARGLSLRAIAESLNESAVPTGQGGNRWYAATVRHVPIQRRKRYAAGGGQPALPREALISHGTCCRGPFPDDVEVDGGACLRAVVSGGLLRPV